MEVKSLQETVYGKLRDTIATGQFRAGDRVVEAQLATKLGVTRGPIREALCRLEHDGFVMRVPGRGVFVNEFQKASLVEVCKIRAVLESLAAREAAARCDEVAAIRLRRQLDKLNQASEQVVQSARPLREELFEADEEFHHLIADIACMPFLKKLLINQFIIRRMLRSEVSFRSPVLDKAEAEASVARHRLIAEAIIAQREEEAAGLAYKHVIRAVEDLRGTLQSAPE